MRWRVGVQAAENELDCDKVALSILSADGTFEQVFMLDSDKARLMGAALLKSADGCSKLIKVTN